MAQPSQLDPEPSAYLTDGSRRFRVVSGFTHTPEDSLAALEISSYSPDELWGMGLSRASA